MKKLLLTFFVLSLFNVTFAASNMGEDDQYKCPALEQSLNRNHDESNEQQIDPKQLIEDANSSQQ